MNHKTLARQEILLPTAYESVAISYKPKTAALCYDRLWSPYYCDHEHVPDSIRCFSGSQIEQQIALTLNFGDLMLDMMSHKFQPDSQKYHDPEIMDHNDLSIEQMSKMVADFLAEFPTGQDGDSILYFAEVAKTFWRQWGIAMVTIYDSAVDWRIQYNDGDSLSLVVDIKDVDIACEDTLTWQQVLEFREDKQSLEKYRRFMYWLTKDMISQSGQFIKDQLSMRLSDYNQSLKKHGIKTVNGAISQVIDQKFMLGSAWTRDGLDVFRHPVLNLLSDGLVVVNKTVLKIGSVFLDLKDMDRGFASEISWVFQTS